MAARLVSLTDEKSIAIDKPVIFIGRDSECDVVLGDSRRVSRKHCCLAHINNRLVVRDLGSMNGVWINGERVERTGTMRPGDELAIGDVRYRLSIEDHSASDNPDQAPDQTPDQPPDQAPDAQDVSMDFPVVVPDLDDDVQQAESVAESDSSEFLALPELPAVGSQDDDGDVIPLDDDGNYNDDDSRILPLSG
jgi:hypothetical protein